MPVRLRLLPPALRSPPPPRPTTAVASFRPPRISISSIQLPGMPDQQFYHRGTADGVRKVARSQSWMAGFPATTPVCSMPMCSAAEVGDDPAGFPDQQDAGRNVPRRQALLPETVKPPGRHVSQIERGRSRPADTAGRRRDASELALIFVEARHVLEWKTGAHQRKPRIGDGRDREAALPQPRAAAPRRRRTSRCEARGGPRPLATHCRLRPRWKPRNWDNRGGSWWFRPAGPPPRPTLPSRGRDSAPRPLFVHLKAPPAESPLSTALRYDPPR